MITIDADHKYSNGLPSVTGLLAEVRLIDPSKYAPGAKERGSAIHLVCQLHDENDLAPESIDPAIRGYYDSYVAWLELYNRSFDVIETPLTNGAYNGMPDRIIKSKPRAVIDIKSGSPETWHKYQTAAYANLLDEPFSYSRLAVYLHSDGSPAKMVEHPKTQYAADLAVFMAALTIHNAKLSK